MACTCANELLQGGRLNTNPREPEPDRSPAKNEPAANPLLDAEVSSIRTVLAALAVAITGIIPLLALPVLYPWMSSQIAGLHAGWLALIMTTGYLTSSLLAPVSGRLADKFGASVSSKIVAVSCGGALISVALASEPHYLIAAVVFGGISQALSVTTSNAIMAGLTSSSRRPASMFGVKQASTPLVSSLVGAAAGAVATRVGFAGVAAAALAAPGLVLLVPSRGTSRRRAGARVPMPAPSALPARDPRMRRLYAVAGFGGLANGAFSTYCVVTLVAAGWSPPAAGLLFGVSGALGVVSRVVAGYVTDRSKVSPMAVASPMLFGGALGALALAFHTPLLAALGAFAGYALGWGAPGLVQFAVATMFPRNVGSATGKVWLWSGLGVSAGPLLFYQVSEHAGSEWSWFGVAGSWAVSAFAARACAKFGGGP